MGFVWGKGTTVTRNFSHYILIIAFSISLLASSGFAATLSTQQYSDLNSIMNAHFNYFLSSNAVTSYGLPLTAYKINDRARFGYSNPTEWGYLLEAYIAAAERGKISRSAAVTKITTTLNTIKALQDNSAQNYNFLFYPYYKVTNSSGADVFPYHDSSTQIPSIDNALLYQSLVIVDGWAIENNYPAVSALAKSIYSRMNFSAFIFTSGSNQYVAHVIDASTGLRGSSKWDVYADEGGLMAISEYLSGSIDLQTFSALIQPQMRSSATWNGITVKEAAWFNSMFTWGVRPLAGIPVIGTSYSKDSFAPTTEAHLAYGTTLGVTYPGFSDAMTQGFVGNYFPPNLSNQVPSSAPAHSTPHAFFVPLNILPDLKQSTFDTLMAKINAVKGDSAGYYYGTGTSYPYGFVVTTSPYANQTAYKGVNAADGKNIFETLSESYIALSAFDALQYQDNSKDFQYFLKKVPGMSAKLDSVQNVLYPTSTIACSSDSDCGPILNSDVNVCIEYTGSDAGKMSDKIIHENIMRLCSDPGTVESTCGQISAIIPVVVADCPNGCLNGACINNTIACTNDLQCNDNDPQTTDTCINPGTTSSSCTNTPTCVTPTIGLQISSSTTLCPGQYSAFDINIVSNNITVDCAGAALVYPTNNAFYRFKIIGRSNVTLKNCTTAKSNFGVWISNSSNITLLNNSFNNSYNSGIYAGNSSKLSIIGNTATGNEYSDGLTLENVKDSNILNNNFYNNGHTTYPNSDAAGIALKNSTGNKIINNDLSSNLRGVYLDSSNSNYFENNNMCNNKYDNSCAASANNTSSANTLLNRVSVGCPWLQTRAATCYAQGSCSADYECNDSNSFTQDVCLNPGTASSVCQNTQIPILCSSNSQCNDNNSSTIDTCMNPGTTTSYCKYTPNPVACTSNAQCGTNAWLGNNFCKSNNIWDTYRTYTCSYPGTTKSKCTVSDAGKLKTSCLKGQLCDNATCVTPSCSTNTQCNDNNANTYDVCTNPGTLQSACTYTPISCLNNAQCNDNNANTIDTCTNPGTVQSKCTYTQISCINDAQCDDGNSLTGDSCINPGLKTSYCKHTPPNPKVLWSIMPTYGGKYFGEISCKVTSPKGCPPELGWEGNKVTYSFTLPTGVLTDNLVLNFDVIYRNYGVSKDVLLKISAGGSTTLKVVNPSLDINKTGPYQVLIPTNYFTQGTTNYIQLYGTNITPVGYGTNPPNFKIDSIGLSQNTQ